jgi:hypothetical protein
MRVHRLVRYSIVALVVAGIAVGAAQMVTAQGPPSGTLGGFKGEIRSIKGNDPIAGAAVSIEGPGGRAMALTGPGGDFLFPDLPPGQYVMDVRADGYKPRQALTVTVVHGAVSPVDVKMRRQGGGPAGGPGDGPYVVVPAPVEEITAANLRDVLNQGHREGFELVTVIPAPAVAGDAPAHHLLVLRKFAEREEAADEE